MTIPPQQQKILTEGLRAESWIERQPMSATIKDLMRFTEEHKNTDPLIVGIDKTINPFVEKSSCSVL